MLFTCGAASRQFAASKSVGAHCASRSSAKGVLGLAETSSITLGMNLALDRLPRPPASFEVLNSAPSASAYSSRVFTLDWSLPRICPKYSKPFFSPPPRGGTASSRGYPGSASRDDSKRCHLSVMMINEDISGPQFPADDAFDSETRIRLIGPITPVFAGHLQQKKKM